MNDKKKTKTDPGQTPPAEPLLPTIDGPADLKDLSYEELTRLAGEIREEIKQVISNNGGHLATNLGIVELTLVLHRLFDFSKDRLVFDVGHQCYTHKLITGRRDRFKTIRMENGLSGYPNRDESEYDTFNAGHAGTSISAALGLACGDEITATDRWIVAVIGDGSINTGLALEGLMQLGHLKKNLIVILNDNEMSISKTVGALAHHLTRIRSGSFYNENKRRIHGILNKLPLGKRFGAMTEHIAQSLMGGILPGQFFEELGMRYYGPIEGHSFEELEKVITNCKKLNGPLLVHVNTKKGHGYLPAKEDPEYYHGAGPFNIEDGSAKKESDKQTYSAVFAETLCRLAADDDRIVAITAAMPLGTGLNVFEKKHPDRFFDVGICEQHAVTFAAGLSDTGLKPVVAIYSTFLQRSYDQIFHDVSMQGDMNILFALDRAGLVGSDGYSHHGLTDISMLRVFPGIILLAPKDKREFEMMIAYAIEQRGIFGLRYPREIAPLEIHKGGYPEIVLGKGEVLEPGKELALLGYGAAVVRLLEARNLLKKDGIRVTVANARFAKPLDLDLLRELAATHKVLVTAEDHALAGGFGSAVLEACSREEIAFDRIINLGIPDRYIAHASRPDQLAALGLDPAGLAKTVTGILRP